MERRCVYLIAPPRHRFARRATIKITSMITIKSSAAQPHSSRSAFH